jgi:hypothetical protein
MVSTFYVVQRNGIAAVWQTSPKRISRMLKRKADFALASATPSGTRRDALIKLRELFPGQRLIKPAANSRAARSRGKRGTSSGNREPALRKSG